MNRKQHGFTLIEIAVVTVIIGILAMTTMPSVMNRLLAARREAEKTTMDTFTEDIKRSFQTTDFNYNIATFSSTIGVKPPTLVTTFRSYNINDTPTSADWLVKLGRMRGVVFTGGTLSASPNAALETIAFNACGQSRWLIAGPTEAGLQRYLLISLLAPEFMNLVIPSIPNNPVDLKAWFDDIWNNDWDKEASDIPSDWISKFSLSNSDRECWVPPGKTITNCHLLVVRRIVQPIFTVTVNNVHPKYYAWLDINGDTSSPPIAPNSTKTPPGVLAGTIVTLGRATSNDRSKAIPVYYQVHVNDNITFNIQP